jgi:hypothetical protein
MPARKPATPKETTQDKKDRLAARVEELFQQTGQPDKYKVLNNPATHTPLIIWNV